MILHNLWKGKDPDKISIEINELFHTPLQALDEIQPKYPIYIFMSHCRSREHTNTDIIFSFSVNFATSTLPGQSTPPLQTRLILYPYGTLLKLYAHAVVIKHFLMTQASILKHAWFMYLLYCKSAGASTQTAQEAGKTQKHLFRVLSSLLDEFSTWVSCGESAMLSSVCMRNEEIQYS